MHTQISYRPPLAGVFAKQAIKKGDILLTISQDCVVSESHPLLQDLASQVVDKAMAGVSRNRASTFKKSKSSRWDLFHKSKRRVFFEDGLRLALHITLLFFAHKRQKSADELLSSPLAKAAAHWDRYLDTLHDDYDSLIFHWTSEELDYT